MKRFITVLICAHIFTVVLYAPDSAYGSMATAGAPGAMALPSESELLSVIDSDDFKKMAKEMGIDVGQMSPQEKADIAKEARGFAQEFTQLPPETQAELMKEMAPELPPAALPAPAPTPIVETKPEPTALSKTESTKKDQTTKPVVSVSRIAEGKKLLNKLVKYIEDIELKFGSLSRTTPDPAREQRWASIEDDLQWTVAALHSMTNNQTLLEHFASNDSQVLYNQIHAMQKSLKSLRKKLVVPDTAKLRLPTGMDAARAEVVPDKVKENSKQAAKSIIDLISRDLPSIRMGNRKLFETYAADELKKLDAKAKTKKDVIPEKKAGSMYTKGTSGLGRDYGAREGGYTPSSYSPYYGSSSSPYSSDHGRSGFGPGGTDGSQAKNAEKDKELTDKEKKDKEAQEKADKEKKEKEDKEKDKTTTKDKDKKGDKEHEKREKPDYQNILKNIFERVDKEAADLYAAGNTFIEEPMGEHRDEQIQTIADKLSPFNRALEEIEYVTRLSVEENKKSPTIRSELYAIIKKHPAVKQVADLYPRYEKKYTSVEKTGHGTVAETLNGLEELAKKYDGILGYTLTLESADELAREAQKELDEYLKREDREVVTKDATTHTRTGITNDTDDIEHALTRLSDLVKWAGRLAPFIKNTQERNKRMTELLRQDTTDVGYFTINIPEHLNHIPVPTGETEDATKLREGKIQTLKAEVDQITKVINGLVTIGTSARTR